MHTHNLTSSQHQELLLKLKKHGITPTMLELNSEQLQEKLAPILSNLVRPSTAIGEQATDDHAIALGRIFGFNVHITLHEYDKSHPKTTYSYTAYNAPTKNVPTIYLQHRPGHWFYDLSQITYGNKNLCLFNTIAQNFGAMHCQFLKRSPAIATTTAKSKPNATLKPEHKSPSHCTPNVPASKKTHFALQHPNSSALLQSKVDFNALVEQQCKIEAEIYARQGRAYTLPISHNNAKEMLEDVATLKAAQEALPTFRS